MADITVNLNRAVNMKIKYPIGVKEPLKITFNDEITLTDDFRIVVSKKGKVILTILDTDTALTKTDNYLSWLLNYDLEADVYDYFYENTTNDYKIFTGEMTVF